MSWSALCAGVGPSAAPMSQFHAASLSQGPFIFDSKFRVREGGVTEAPGESLKYIYASRSRLPQQRRGRARGSSGQMRPSW